MPDDFTNYLLPEDVETLDDFSRLFPGVREWLNNNWVQWHPIATTPITPTEKLEPLPLQHRKKTWTTQGPWFAFKERSMDTQQPKRRKTKERKMETPEVLPTPPPEAAGPKPPEQITCTIKLVAGVPKITHSIVAGKGTVPSTSQVVNFLAPNLAAQAQNVIGRYGWYTYEYLASLIQQMWGIISVEAWAEAFCKAATAINNAKVEATAIAPNPTPPVYITWGDTLYKLTPDRNIPINDELAAAKARATDEAQAYTKSTIDYANQQKESILANANKLNGEVQARVIAARAELATLRKEISKVPPEWLGNGRFFYQWDVDKGCWVVLLPVRLQITRFDYNYKTYKDGENAKILRKSWAAKPYHDHMYFHVRVPITTSIFSITSVTGDAVALPHMTTGRSCVAIGDCPARIDSVITLNSLADSISRAYSVVDLNSMTTVPGGWDPRVWVFVPNELADILQSEDWINDIERAIQTAAATPAKGVEVITYDGERKETWTVK